MDRKAFQRRLAELLSAAEQNGGKVSAEELRVLSAEDGFGREQALAVLAFLKEKGIRVDGVGPDAEEEADGGLPEELTPEEQAYLEDYLAGFPDPEDLTDAEEEALFREAVRGERSAREKLTLRYLPEAAKTAAGAERGELLFQDLLQEAFLALASVWETEAAGRYAAPDAVIPSDLSGWVREQVKDRLDPVLQEYSRRKTEDRGMVERVEKLDKAVKDLMDDEDGILPFSMDELAVVLDMDEDEIRAVFRLTGDL